MVLMTHRKFICIVLTLVFGLSLFASGALGRVTCDKEQCRHDAMKGIEYHKAEMNFGPVGCCAETQIDPCELEGVQPRVIQDYAVSMTRVHKDGPSDAMVSGSGFMFDNFALSVVGPLHNIGTKVPSSPIYIKNVSLIC